MTGIYLGKDNTIHRRQGYNAALRYLQRKQEERLTNSSMSVVAWVIGACCVWGIVWLLMRGW